MAKRVLLKFDGALEHGFQITLDIGEADTLSDVEETGSLPPSPMLVDGLEHWRTVYRQVSHSTRIGLKQITVRTSTSNQLEECRRAAKDLQKRLIEWLDSPPFHAIDRQLRESLHVQEPVQVLL